MFRERDIRRVLMTGDTVGGVWTFTLELAETLGAQGIEVVLAACGGDASHAQREEAAAVPHLVFLNGNYKLEWMEDPWADVEASGEWLMEITRDYRPDVIHLNSFGHGALPWDVPTVLAVHSTVTAWFEAVRGEVAPREWNRYRALVAESLRAADLVTAPSASVAEEFPDVDCRVIPNGRDGRRFHRSEKEPLILTAGRLWDKAKNVDAVVEVARFLSWPVYLAGESYNSTVGHCRPLGRLSQREIANWYARAAIYVLPARYEPFGLSVLEAALSGCALVLGDIPSLRQIWRDAALFVLPDDSETLRRTLEVLISDPDLRHTMSRRAHDRALTFSAARTGELYLQAYADAARSRMGACVS